jgi:hypothetical protein
MAMSISRQRTVRPRPQRRAEEQEEMRGGGGEGLYRTGDLARLRGDGSHEFLGRIDQQIKVRGLPVRRTRPEVISSRENLTRGHLVAGRPAGANRRRSGRGLSYGID